MEFYDVVIMCWEFLWVSILVEVFVSSNNETNNHPFASRICIVWWDFDQYFGTQAAIGS